MYETNRTNRNLALTLSQSDPITHWLALVPVSRTQYMPAIFKIAIHVHIYIYITQVSMKSEKGYDGSTRRWCKKRPTIVATCKKDSWNDDKKSFHH